MVEENNGICFSVDSSVWLDGNKVGFLFHFVLSRLQMKWMGTSPDLISIIGSGLGIFLT
jgi:hypothetical protein